MRFSCVLKLMCEGDSKEGQCTSISTFDFVVEVIRPIIHTIENPSVYRKINHCRVITGDIIDHADHKRLLGLFLRYGTILLLLELIAPSRAVHARTCYEELCGCSAREMAWEIPEIFLLLAHNSMRLCLLEFCLNIFVVSCSSFSEVR